MLRNIDRPDDPGYLQVRHYERDSQLIVASMLAASPIKQLPDFVDQTKQNLSGM